VVVLVLMMMTINTTTTTPTATPSTLTPSPPLLQATNGAYLCPDDPHKYLSRDLQRTLQPLGVSQVTRDV
jgi:hypothetical protein